MFLAFFLVARSAQAAFDINLRAFFQVFAGDFRQATEKHHAMPFRAFLLVAGLLVLPLLAGCNVDPGDGVAVGRIFHIRVSAQIPDDNYLVDSPCHDASPYLVEFVGLLPESVHESQGRDCTGMTCRLHP